MGLYEHTFLVRQDAAQAQVDALIEQYKGVLAAGGAKVEKVEQWGIKSSPSASRRTARLSSAS